MSRGEVKAWDTKGVTGVGAIVGGKINLKFEGQDGSERSIFIPLASVPSLVQGVCGLTTEAGVSPARPGRGFRRDRSTLTVDPT